MMTEKREERAWGLDVLKFICACMIVCIHCSYPGSDQIKHYLRAAVPVFYMITGYFYENTKSRGRQAAQIKKLLLLYLCIYPLYALWDFLMMAIPVVQGGVEPLECFWQWLLFCLFGQRQVWIDFFLFNYVTNDNHLWYLASLIYVLAIVAVLDRIIDRRKLYPLIPLLLLMNLLLGNYAQLLLGRELPVMYSRNFLFTGIPCFLLGDLLYHSKSRSVKKEMTIAVLVFAAVGTSLELRLLEKNGWEASGDLFFSTVIAALALFRLALTGESAPRRWQKLLSGWGRKYAQWIYFFHPLVIMVLSYGMRGLADSSPIREVYYTGMPVVILALSLVLAYIIRLAGTAIGRTRVNLNEK